MAEDLRADVLVIGWGKAGKTIAGALGGQGRRVVMVEQTEGMQGGACINVACVPTKSLVHSAETRRPGDDQNEWFGDSVASRNELTAKLRSANFEMLDTVDTVTLLSGRARFVDPHTVQVTVGDETLSVTAKTIIVNTGSTATIPDLPGAEGNPLVHTSVTLQHVNPLPHDLIIVGGGYIGLEFAGMFARFGSRVTVLDRGPGILPEEDDDIADAVRDSLVEVGVRFVHEANVSALEGRKVVFDARGETRSVTADAVLFAVGRRPLTEGLDLQQAGVETDEGGAVRVGTDLRSSQPHIFAVGDVNGGPQFTYISNDDHRIVLDQLVGAGQRRTSDRVAVPSTTFVTPPLGRVGPNERQAREAGLRVRTASKKVSEIAAMPRPKIVGNATGLIKFVVDADTDLVLGASVFCVDAQEFINLIALAIRAGVTASQLRDGIWTHPSTTEALNEVLAGLNLAPEKT